LEVTHGPFIPHSVWHGPEGPLEFAGLSHSLVFLQKPLVNKKKGLREDYDASQPH
jgi:hypothetical protein